MSYVPADVDEPDSLDRGRAGAASNAAAAQGLGSALGSMQQPDPQLSILQQSAHPIALIALFAFRSAAVATYLLCGAVDALRDPGAEGIRLLRQLLRLQHRARGRPALRRLLDRPSAC